LHIAATLNRKLSHCLINGKKNRRGAFCDKLPDLVSQEPVVGLRPPVSIRAIRVIRGEPAPPVRRLFTGGRGGSGGWF
jgi:hypothetical protein